MRSISRRRAIRHAAALVALPAIGRGLQTLDASLTLPHAASAAGRAQPATARSSVLEPLDSRVLPPGVRARFVDNGNGARMHVLEAGFEERGRPGVLLLHGFPELAYCWRKVLGPLAAAGYHVIAPDLRGYGRTTGWDVGYDDDLAPFTMLNEVRDMLGLVSALGYRSVALVGHDFGSLVAGWCAMTRPDVFDSVALMSAPFDGAPAIPFDTQNKAPSAPASRSPDAMQAELARLQPPRKPYRQYYSSRQANADMWKPPQGVQAFLRAYYHVKSADWPANAPHRLKSSDPSELARLPRYYVMDLDKGMPDTVAGDMPTPEAIAACRWLPDTELRVFSEEYARTGFQGGLQGYRVRTGARFLSELQLFSGRTIDVPACFISGTQDWGMYQTPGALERLQRTVCRRMIGT